MEIRQAFRHTRYACYLGYIVQAIVNNYAPLLFLVFGRDFRLGLDQIGYLVAANFGVQLLVDFLAAQFVDKIGYRVSVLIAHGFSIIGLVGLAWFPALLPTPFIGLLLAMACYAVGGGLIEVLISPIIDACPSEGRSNHMSLLHSFYCWGFAGVVLLSTVFFHVAGIGKWRMLACLWAAVPAANAVYFMAVPLPAARPAHERWSIRRLCTQRLFWVFVLLMICSGAAEQAMSQWISAFVEAGLHISKTVGDLIGPCLFAVLMGVARTLLGLVGGRIDLRRYMTVSAVVGVLGYAFAAFSTHVGLALLGCALCGLTVGIMWPGTISLAAQSPMNGTAMFALLAFAGDIGAITGPAIVGVTANAENGSLQKGFVAVIVFPILLAVILCFYKRRNRRIGQDIGESR